MAYYIQTIEQIRQDGVLKEYGGMEKVNDETSALSKYYKKLSDVAADLGNNHTYMSIRLITSEDYMVKGDTVGAYVEEE